MNCIGLASKNIFIYIKKTKHMIGYLRLRVLSKITWKQFSPKKGRTKSEDLKQSFPEELSEYGKTMHLKSATWH